MIFVGIDVSKLSFDVAIFIENEVYNRHFENNPIGFLQLFK